MPIPDTSELFLPEVKTPCISIDETLHFGPHQCVDSVPCPASLIRDTNQCVKIVIKLIEQVHAKKIPVSGVSAHTFSMWDDPWFIEIAIVGHYSFGEKAPDPVDGILIVTLVP